MAEEKQLRVDQEYYVNEATLDLLQRRIASGVKTSLVAWVGAPVGILGILAIAYAIIFTIPQEVKKATNTFLQDPDTGQAVLQTAVAAYLGKSQDGQQILKEKVQTAVGVYLNDSETGRGTIQKQVKAYLTSASGQNVIKNQVKRELKPTMTALLDPMKKNANKLVAQARAFVTPGGVERFEKDTVGKLFEFLNSPEGEQLKSGSFNIALTKHIFRGPVYNANAIKIHLDTLESEFPKRFRHVVLYDREDHFIARIDPGLFRNKLISQRDSLMSVLNGGPQEMSSQEVKKTLNRIFGMSVTDWVREDWKLVHALKQPAWGEPPDPTKQVAVLSAENRFIGTTTRSTLLNEIFNLVGGTA